LYQRCNKRKNDELRPVTIDVGYLRHTPASVMVEFGNTKVLCAASIDEKVAPFLKGTGKGWVTAEYSMLPMSTQTRQTRESARGKIGGRTHEIQRLIGRSLRAVTDLSALGERTICIDCDVIQADGGTRTASITGAFVALVELFREMSRSGLLEKIPVCDYVAALSTGIINGVVLLDLDYEEDSRAEVDMNFVMTGAGLFIEIQGTAEQKPFNKDRLDEMTALAKDGIDRIITLQRQALDGWQA